MAIKLSVKEHRACSMCVYTYLRDAVAYAEHIRVYHSREAGIFKGGAQSLNGPSVPEGGKQRWSE